MVCDVNVTVISITATVKSLPHHGEFCDILIANHNKLAIHVPSHPIVITIRELLGFPCSQTQLAATHRQFRPDFIL